MAEQENTPLCGITTTITGSEILHIRILDREGDVVVYKTLTDCQRRREKTCALANICDFPIHSRIAIPVGDPTTPDAGVEQINTRYESACIGTTQTPKD